MHIGSTYVTLIEFDGLLGSDFLEQYNCIIDFKNRSLVTNFKLLPLFKVIDETVMSDSNKPPVTTLLVDNISIDAKTEQIYKLVCRLRNTDAILTAAEIYKVRLPNAIVKVNDKREFLTSILSLQCPKPKGILSKYILMK